MLRYIIQNTKKKCIKHDFIESLVIPLFLNFNNVKCKKKYIYIYIFTIYIVDNILLEHKIFFLHIQYITHNTYIFTSSSFRRVLWLKVLSYIDIELHLVPLMVKSRVYTVNCFVYRVRQQYWRPLYYIAM